MIHIKVIQITFLINLSIKTQTFPSAWKLAVVTPIPKKVDRRSMANLRPISLIHICDKVTEKVVNGMITTYTSINKINSPKQFGFVRQKSTTDCIDLCIA